MTLNHEPLAISLTQRNIQVARQVASQSTVAIVQTRLYLNALALQAGTLYFQGLDLAMSPELADSSQASWSLMTGSFDLYLTGLGALECCAVLPGDNDVIIPPESRENRLGYLVIEIDELNGTANLLGFLQSVGDRLVVPLSAVKSLDQLLDYLEDLERQTSLAARLSQWLQAAELAAMKGWELIEESLIPKNPLVAVRSRPTISNQVRFKRMLAIARHDSDLELVLLLQPVGDQKLKVTISLRPASLGQTLPEDLAIALRTDDNQEPINLKPNPVNGDLINFSGSTGDRFAISITTGDYTYSESFEI